MEALELVPNRSIVFEIALEPTRCSATLPPFSFLKRTFQYYTRGGRGLIPGVRLFRLQFRADN